MIQKTHYSYKYQVCWYNYNLNKRELAQLIQFHCIFLAIYSKNLFEKFKIQNFYTL